MPSAFVFRNGSLLGIASFSEYFSKLSGKPPLLSKGKVEEMVQKNWVCDITKAKTALGFRTPNPASARSQINRRMVQKRKLVVAQNEVAYGCL